MSKPEAPESRKPTTPGGVLPGTPAGTPATGPGILPGTPDEKRDQGKQAPRR
jgi:hypothetical protein